MPRHNIFRVQRRCPPPIRSAGADGTLTINTDGTYSYAVTSHSASTDIFTITTLDQNGFVTATTLSFNVPLVNVAPETSATSSSGLEDAASIAVSLSGSDVDGTVVSFKINSLPVNGTLYSDAALTHVISSGDSVTASGNAAQVYFKPAADWSGSTSFHYAAVDNQGVADPTPATATISVNAVADAPHLTTMAASDNDGSFGCGGCRHRAHHQRSA